MKVCSNCFSDIEIISFINSRTSKIGKCVFCNSSDVNLIDIEELYEFFEVFFKNYQSNTKGISLIDLVQRDWNIFSSNKIGIEIINFAINQLRLNIGSAYDFVDYIPDILENVNYWNILKNNIKWKNRYVTDIEFLNEDLGWDRLLGNTLTISNNEIFYRGRLHHMENLDPYSNEEMFCPNPVKATSGRANPVGIPFLYLCDNRETVLYEIRSSFLDELSIGTFVLNEEINKEIMIADFTEIPSIFFQDYIYSSDVSDKIKAKLLKDLISIDLSKPMRRYDTEIDYIPTQFICEFIKVYSGAQGIKFRSSLHPEGNNIVIFDKNIMTCKYVEKVKVKNVTISV